MKAGILSRRPLVLAGALTVIAVGALALFGRDEGQDVPTAMPMAGEASFRESIAADGAAGPDLSSRAKEEIADSPPVVPGLAGAASGGAVAGETNSSGGSGVSGLADDRKIVQTASLRLEVEEVGVGFEEVGRIAAGAGGFVGSSSFSNQGDRQVASVTVRVPATRYQETLSELRRLGHKVVAEDSKSSDVTAEYTDLGSRLRNLEATETQLLVLLERAETVNEILQVQDRLNSVRNEVEQVKGRMAMIDKLTELATITVHLQPIAAAQSASGGGSRLGNEISAAWDDSIAFLTDIAAAAVHVVVFAWWLPVVGIPALLIGNRLLRSRPRRIEAVD